jgi:hypothetical protein
MSSIVNLNATVSLGGMADANFDVNIDASASLDVLADVSLVWGGQGRNLRSSDAIIFRCQLSSKAFYGVSYLSVYVELFC